MSGADSVAAALRTTQARLLLRRRLLWLRSTWPALRTLDGGGAISDAYADLLSRGSDAAAEAAFYREHPAAAALSAEITANGRRLEEVADGDRMTRLRGMFDLDDFECGVLQLAFAVEQSPGIDRLCAYVQDDLGLPCATPQLAIDVLGAGDVELLQRFLPGARLRRFALIEISFGSRGLASSPVRLDERMTAYLQGDDHVEHRLLGAIRLTPWGITSPDEGETATRVAGLVAAAARRSGWPAVALLGSARAGRRAVARRIAELLNLRLCDLVVAAGADVAQLLEREAALSGLAYYAGPDVRPPRHLDALVLMAGQPPEAWPGEVIPVRLPAPDTDAQRALWAGLLAGSDAAHPEAVEAIVQQFDMGSDDISQAALGAIQGARMRTGHAEARPALADVLEACKVGTGSRLDNYAHLVTARHRWEHIVLPAESLAQLRSIADQAAQRGRVYGTWGFGERLGRGRGITALFAGPSGTGKTMAAEILAGHLGLDLYRLDLASVVSKYIGETEKNLRALFEAADNASAVVFIDESDSLYSKRTDVRSAHDKWANAEVNYLLQLMEDYRGIAILATNRRGLLDRAFLRRIRFLVDFPFPDRASRRRMWELAFPATAPVAGLDFDLLSRLELSGGNIRTITLNAAFLAAAESGPIGMAHVVLATRREYAKLERPLSELEQLLTGRQVA